MKSFSIKNNTNKGVTLIETLVYLALFAILFGGAVIATYSLIESNGRGQAQVLLEEEGNFIVSKISSALSGAKSVEMPSVGATSSKLSLTKWDPSLNTVVIQLNSGNVTISKNSGADVVFNNPDVSVSNLNFKQNYNGGTNPKSVNFSFTITSRSLGGVIISQDFAGEKYFRK